MLPINDRALWGNEAADDEDPLILDSYFVSQPVFAPFFDPAEKLSIARARKGLGKSALLRQCAFWLKKQPPFLVIQLKGADLVAQRPVQPLRADEHIYDWQQRICMVINKELGKWIGVALTDDRITLVETAELVGYRQRNLVGALLDRLGGKLGEIQLNKIGAADHKALLSRVTEGQKDHQVWLFIDDIDATFRRFTS